MTDTKHRSCCPIACTLDVIGDKWTLLIIRDLARGRSHFSEFCRSPEGIATNILSNRLDRLIRSGLVQRYPSTERLRRDAYRLTDKGRSLEPVLAEIAKWGSQHLEGTSDADVDA